MLAITADARDEDGGDGGGGRPRASGGARSAARAAAPTATARGVAAPALTRSQSSKPTGIVLRAILVGVRADAVSVALDPRGEVEVLTYL